MLIEKVKQMTARERFLYFVKERNQIYQRRTAGFDKPWTDDYVLQNYFFTNIRRELDKTTIWYKENIRWPLSDKKEVVFATIAFRWINLPATAEELLRPVNYFVDWDEAKVHEILCARKERGEQVFTGAFNISNAGMSIPKIDGVVYHYIRPCWEDRDLIYERITEKPTMAKAFSVLSEYKGFGGSGFMAAQVICDLAYTHVLASAPDWYTWCSWGPGSKRGMNLVLDLEEKHKLPRKEWDENLALLQKLILVKNKINLHARDVQNCLCEFSKYERILWRRGGGKRKYPGSK